MRDGIPRKVGVYARVSREDLQKKKHTSSESIENQKRLAQVYVQSSEDDLEIVKYYIDDGKTGTVTDRPAYQELLEDAKQQKINMIIVKDFSRLSRDSVDALKFIEYDIQKLNVRFVSLGEGFDSFYSKNGIDDLKMGFLAVLNSTYPADISRKVSMNLDIKRQDGKYVGAFAPYGYRKNPQNKYELVIDEPAAAVVKRIFSLFLEGVSKQNIARQLNAEGILCPTEYKKVNHSKYQPAQKGYHFYVWTYSTIQSILSNEVYIGNLVQKKTKMIKVLEEQRSRKRKVPIEAGKEIRIEHTHPSIIDTELFQIVAKYQKKQTRSSKKEKKISFFSGVLKCADCKRAMYRCYSNTAKKEKVYYYRCSTYKNAPQKVCTAHTIEEQKLLNCICSILEKMIELSMEQDIVKQLYFCKNIEEKEEQKLLQEEKKYKVGRERLLQAYIHGMAEEDDLRNYDILWKQRKKRIVERKEKVVSTIPDTIDITRVLLLYFVREIMMGEGKQITISFRVQDIFLF